jgi:hypothetical protein
MVQHVEISKLSQFKMQVQDLIARSKNLAKADLMSSPPELSIFSEPQIAFSPSSLTRWAQLNQWHRFSLISGKSEANDDRARRQI